MIAFTNEGVHPYPTLDSFSYPYGDRQNVYDPRTTSIHEPERRRKTQRTMPPLQGTQTHPMSLSQENPGTTRVYRTCTNHPSGRGSRDETTLIPNDGQR